MSAASAGYSGTPLPRKLGIKPGARLALLAAPNGFEDALGPLPDGVRVTRAARGRLDVIVAFFTERRELERRLPVVCRALEPDGGLWIAWPKRASALSTDLGERAVRDLGLSTRLVDNKICAIDEVWSALRFVYRLSDRSG